MAFVYSPRTTTWDHAVLAYVRPRRAPQARFLAAMRLNPSCCGGGAGGRQVVDAAARSRREKAGASLTRDGAHTALPNAMPRT